MMEIKSLVQSLIYIVVTLVPALSFHLSQNSIHSNHFLTTGAGTGTKNRISNPLQDALPPKYSMKNEQSPENSVNIGLSTSQDSILEGGLEWRREGYNFWDYEGQRIHYTAHGDRSKPPVLLIHGFGASHFHWRYNIPELVKQYRVYAIDLLGFGLSDKPIIEYNAEVWRDQAAAFVRDIVQPECGEESKVVVAGNSLGGYTALAFASEFPELVSSCVLLNGAGRFETPEEKEMRLAQEAIKKSFFDQLKEEFGKIIQRAVIAASFIYTKQPLRIKQVLTQVYPVDATNVDDVLVESIYVPALDPNAAEVFYRIINRNGGGPQKSVNELLTTLSVPLLLLWGEKDPWIRPTAADKIQELYPSAKRVSVNAGHCPHDEAPVAVNEALLAWCKQSFAAQTSL